MQKVSVFLDDKGIPALDELVTQTVVNAVCSNFNALMKAGLVMVKLDYTEPEYQDIFGDDNLTYSMVHTIKPSITLIPQSSSNKSVIQILMPK